MTFDAALAHHRAGRLAQAEDGYRRVLEEVPDHADALNLLGVVMRLRGRPETAVELISRAAALAPGVADFKNNLGNALVDLDRPDEAIEAYRGATAQDPGFREAWTNLGNVLTDRGRHAEAAECYGKALAGEIRPVDATFGLGRALLSLGAADEAVEHLRDAVTRDPEHAEAWYALGEAQEALGRRKEAIAAFREATRLDSRLGVRKLTASLKRWFGFGKRAPVAKAAPEPARASPLPASPDPTLDDGAEAHNAEGKALVRAGRLDDAVKSFLEAVARNPNFGEAYGNLGVALHALGREAMAIGPLRRATELLPTSPDAYNNLGGAFGALRQFDEAIHCFRKALALNQDHADTLNNYGIALMATNALGDAVEALEKALRLRPDSIDTMNNLGTALHRVGRLTEGRQLVEAVVKADPKHVKAPYNLGNMLRAEGRTEDALALFRRAICLAPAEVLAHWNYALCLLGAGLFREGWKEYEWRWRYDGFTGPWRNHPQPRWRGEDLKGRTILVHAEQGPGDVLLYGTMLPDLIAAGARIVFECDPRMGPLFERSLPGLSAIPMTASPDPRTRDPAIDFVCPIASLAQYLRPDFDSFPMRERYLRPDPALAERLRARYRGLGGDRVVGVSWNSKSNDIGWAKSTRLVDWGPILRVPGVTFVNLQYGDCAADLAEVRRAGIHVFDDAEVNPLIDMEAFAAQVAACDLVISVSNTTVHMAGALGVPVWAMLPSGHGLIHYWLQNRDDSPWYPSLRLYRQPGHGDWESVFRRVADDLTEVPR
ncbi:MAG: tetratricopeptide repeat protein [Alphaproteobacteria bacterium]|nr:tetratricopeptide repeat protein [Alphaproteobacteria bacterium]